MERHAIDHDIELVTRAAELSGGDMLFLVSCSEIVDAEIRSRYKHSLVLHGSDLPEGRGWSPVVWQVLEGRTTITVTLLEAADQVDSGDIWAKTTFELAGNELADEINKKLFDAELRLMDYALSNIGLIKPCAQDAARESHYRKRSPEDSRLNPELSLAEQFELMRVADPERFPCYFDHRGYRYILHLKKAGQKGD
ncbi:MAG: formyltransferase family protein [Burkholderiales bacterium]|nr:formyltransferase family protein [Burkholderiales bacterium]